MHLPWAVEAGQQRARHRRHLDPALFRWLAEDNEERVKGIELQRHDRTLSRGTIGRGLDTTRIRMPEFRDATSNAKAHLRGFGARLAISDKKQVAITQLAMHERQWRFWSRAAVT